MGKRQYSAKVGISNMLGIEEHKYEGVLVAMKEEFRADQGSRQ